MSVYQTQPNISTVLFLIYLICHFSFIYSLVIINVWFWFYSAKIALNQKKKIVFWSVLRFCHLCDFIVKVSVNFWCDVNYLSQSLWGSLLGSPWTDLIWISSPSRSCSIGRDTPGRTCMGGKDIYLHSHQNHTTTVYQPPDQHVYRWRRACEGTVSWSLGWLFFSHITIS